MATDDTSLGVTNICCSLGEAIRKGYEMSLENGLRLEADLSSLLQTSEDIKEGARAFVEKRPPQFKGR